MLGFFSYSIGKGSIATLEARDQDEFRDFLMEKGSKIALVTNSWSAQDDAQLSARRSEHLEVLDDARFAQRLNFSIEVVIVQYPEVVIVVLQLC